MENLKNIIQTRRSIRKYEPTEISNETIREIIESAAYAPSACNSQCWKFIAVKDKDMIAKLSSAVTDGIKKFYSEQSEDFISNRINQATFFRNAPLVISVIMTEMKYHDQRVTDVYTEKGFSGREMSVALGEPDVLSIGAAVQNMLLTINEKGLGACWMNDPIVSSSEISELFNIPNNERLMSIIPVGVPAYKAREKHLKPLDDILTII